MVPQWTNCISLWLWIKTRCTTFRTPHSRLKLSKGSVAIKACKLQVSLVKMLQSSNWQAVRMALDALGRNAEMEARLTLPRKKVSSANARTETETASLVCINSQQHLFKKAAHRRLRLWISSHLEIRQPSVFHKDIWSVIHTSLRNTPEVQTVLKQASNNNNYPFIRRQLASRTRLTAPSLTNR